MRFQLTDYQLLAAREVIDSVLDSSERFNKSGKLSAIALAAPTGAGKTVIATKVIETLLFGSDSFAARPQTTFLWVSDDPSLNVQTRRKMLIGSSKLRPSRLIPVDPSLDQQILHPGRVYFVHIQQLGKGATKYTRPGNNRQYTIWETIGQTIAERGSDFVLIIDEAHRGTGIRSAGSKTIVSQLIDGAGGEFPPAPVVLGISATPQRFSEAMSRAGQRLFFPVSVDLKAVRDSGLLKDKIRISHPKRQVPGDTTLLAQAVADLRKFDAMWEEYSKEQDEPLVRPALVIQVKPKSSERELSEILSTLESCWGVLKGKAVVHAFQEHSSLQVGSRTVRYVAPQDIQDDASVRVVLFKEALTTGWDCPRAEVMISLRPAKDYTYIAQLVGRMVRTPLARRIDTNDVLNSVALYLPHFDSDQISKVVNNLQADDQIVSEVEVNGVVCERNTDLSAEVWKAVKSLPTYTRPSRVHRNEVVRLNSLAILLNGVGLLEDAPDQARQRVVATLLREAARMKGALDERVKDLEKLEYETLELDFATSGIGRTESRVARDSKNIDDLFRRARQTWGDATADWYWNHLCDEGIDSDTAKLYAAALAQEPSVAEAVKAAAKSLIDIWRKAYNKEISLLPDAKRAAFYQIWQQARDPEQIHLILPSQLSAAAHPDRYPKHLYASSGEFPAKLSGWEEGVLTAELQRDSLVAWYRNPSAGAAAIAVPYLQSGTPQTMYPDFVFFHETEAGVAVDIIDPHNPSQADTGPKWLGLAKYAIKHKNSYRRVMAVIRDQRGELVGLDLKNPAVIGKLEKARTEPDIRKLFEDFGGSY